VPRRAHEGIAVLERSELVSVRRALEACAAEEPAATPKPMDQGRPAELRAVARITSTSAVPALHDKDWTVVTFEPAVDFEPHPELRSMAFRGLAQRPCDAVFWYQPGDPDRLFGVWSGPRPLYQKRATLGEVEVGFALDNPMTCVMAGAMRPSGVMAVTDQSA
jgi:hypothetical protein